jgi:choline dehydrogenase-like flavoprotein
MGVTGRQRHHRCLPDGLGWPDLNIAEARRQSSADASLTPVLHRPNLALVAGALAHRVRVQRGAPQVHRRLPPRGRPARSTDPTLAARRDVLARHGLCGESTDSSDSC